MKFVLGISLFVSVLGAACSCSQVPAVRPLTAKLYGELGLDNANIQNVQFYYRAKKRQQSIDRTRDTVFQLSESTEKKSVAVEKKPHYEKEIRVASEAIVLYNGTPCVVRNAEKTNWKTYLLKVDFGDEILLDFENNRPDGIFYLVSKKIELNGKTYAIGKDLYGYLAVEAGKSFKKRSSDTIYEIRGKSIQ
jgi:hypothetical protein